MNISEVNEIKQDSTDGVHLTTGSSPHVGQSSTTSRTMMVDVMIGLLPVLAVSIFVFKWYAAEQLLICVSSCLLAEAVFEKMRKKQLNLDDFSAVITGFILAFSLPASSPWFVGFIASVIAMGMGKAVFGGLGMNIFNPAMVGRAFVVIAFANYMGASGYVDPVAQVDAVTSATPLSAFKQSGVITPLSSLFLGLTNGSLGETSSLACLVGGIFLCIRRTIAWEIPASILLVVLVLSAIPGLNNAAGWSSFHQIFSGALMFTAFFIATDPVTSPITLNGRIVFGTGIGAFIMLLRLFSGYPEGAMFAVLFMNALTPLINRWTIPRPFGNI